MLYFEGAVLASCCVVGVGAAALSALQKRDSSSTKPKMRRRRKQRNHTKGSPQARVDDEDEPTLLDSQTLSQTLSSANSTTSSLGLQVAETLHTQLPPMCPDDRHCMLLNEPTHYQQFRHTCRLSPCFFAHVEEHARLFQHNVEQLMYCEAPRSSSRGTSIKSSESGGSGVHGGRHVDCPRPQLPFSSQTLLSPVAPNSEQAHVVCNGSEVLVWGNWSKVRIHTVRRYLHQVTGVPPLEQLLYLALGDQRILLDDDTAIASTLGIQKDSTIIVEHK